MAISTATMSMDDLSTLITKAISAQLEELIKQKLADVVDEIVSATARDLADRTSLAVHSMHSPIGVDNWGPKVVVHLVFNSKDIVYTAEKESP